jgi:glycosyltransferase involved in cell wall biosynthesis
MKVAYLLASTEVSGGVQVVLRQAEALARRGHRVAVVSPEAAPDWFVLSRARFERSSFRASRELADADVRVATFWTTAAAAVAGAHGPVFHLCQGYEGSFDFYRERWPEIDAAYRLPTRKLAISATVAALLERRGYGPAFDVGQAFDARPFFPGPPRPVSTPPVVLVVGPAAASVKGLDVAFDGLALLRGRGLPFRLRRISTLGPDDSERQRGLADEFHRGLDPERMPFAYRASDVFVGPSRPQEGFGLPALEALACGVPVLLSDTAGHRELAGDAAWYFRDGDPESLAATLPALWSQTARAAARSTGPTAAARFDAAGVAERLERAFRAALDAAA